MRALWKKEGESRGEKAIRAGVPLAGKVSPFPASFPFGKEHPFHVGVGEARVGGKFDIPGTADDAEGAFGRAFLSRIAQRAGTGGIAEQEQTLSEDEYFVLCDSRSNTDDSRNSAFGMVKKSQIIGKVSFRLKPFSRVTKPEQKTTQTQEEEN